MLEKSRKSGWKRERSFPIKRDTHRFPIIPVLFTGKHGSPTVENRSLFSSSPYPPISYIIAEPRNRQFHVGWNVTSLHSPDLGESLSNFFLSKILSVNVMNRIEWLERVRIKFPFFFKDEMIRASSSFYNFGKILTRKSLFFYL